LAELYEELIIEAIQYMFSMLELVTIESDSPYYQEMEGIAEVLGRSTFEVMMLNYLYELDAYCTSIVTRLNNGSIILARNLDFYFPNETRKILYIGKFYRGNQLIFEAPMIAGTIGIFTGIKPHSFAIAINERTKKESSFDFF